MLSGCPCKHYGWPGEQNQSHRPSKYPTTNWGDFAKQPHFSPSALRAQSEKTETGLMKERKPSQRKINPESEKEKENGKQQRLQPDGNNSNNTGEPGKWRETAPSIGQWCMWVVMEVQKRCEGGVSEVRWWCQGGPMQVPVWYTEGAKEVRWRGKWGAMEMQKRSDKGVRTDGGASEMKWFRATLTTVATKKLRQQKQKQEETINANYRKKRQVNNDTKRQLRKPQFFSLFEESNNKNTSSAPENKNTKDHGLQKRMQICGKTAVLRRCLGVRRRRGEKAISNTHVPSTWLNVETE